MSPSDELIYQLRTTLGKMEVALSAVGEAIVWTDIKGRIQWCNSGFDRLVGKRHLEILGRELIVLLPFFQDGQEVLPEAYPVNVVLRTESAFHGYYEFYIRGQALTLDISAGHARLGSAELSVILICRDVTERKKVERMLQAKLDEIESMNRIMVGREERLLEMKREVNDLLAELGKEPKYSM